MDDASILFESMAGADPLDPTSLPDPVPATRSELRQGVAGLRIGFDRRAALESGQRGTPPKLAAVTQVRSEVSASIESMLKTVDCLVCPSMANSARMKEANPFDEETDEAWSATVRNDIHTQPFNFSGSQTLSVPCGFAADGLPLSVQFVGRRLSESMLCRIGHAYEQATPWHLKHPVV